MAAMLSQMCCVEVARQKPRCHSFWHWNYCILLFNLASSYGLRINQDDCNETHTFGDAGFGNLTVLSR
jgi:hypothetical protein